MSARTLYAEAMMHYQSLEHVPGRASVGLKTGDLELFAGRLAEAEQGFSEAHALYAGAQDELGRAYALARLGDLDLRRGRSEGARQRLREALAVFQGFPGDPGLGEVLQSLGDAEREESRLTQARTRYREAQTAFERAGDERGRANVLVSMGDLEYREDHYDQARALFEQGLHMLEDARRSAGPNLCAAGIGPGIARATAGARVPQSPGPRTSARAPARLTRGDRGGCPYSARVGGSRSPVVMGSACVRAGLGMALLVAALAWPAMAHLQDGDSGGLDPAERLPSTIRGELPLPHRTVLGVVVGRDSLMDVQERLGQAVRFAPVGSVDVVAVCYALDDEQGSVVLFQADSQDPHAVVLIAHATRRSSLGGMARHCQRTAARGGAARQRRRRDPGYVTR